MILVFLEPISCITFLIFLMINFASIIFLKEYSLSYRGRGGISIFRRSILLEIHMLATQAANYGGPQQILQEASET